MLYFVGRQARPGISAKQFQQLAISCIQTVALRKQIKEDDRAFSGPIEPKGNASADTQGRQERPVLRPRLDVDRICGSLFENPFCVSPDSFKLLWIEIGGATKSYAVLLFARNQKRHLFTTNQV